MTYSLPENLVLKVCAYFDRELNAQDYIPEGEQKDRLFAQADKEYYSTFPADIRKQRLYKLGL